MGLGRLAVSARRLCHCCGSPVNFCSRGSKPVWTRCSKLDGAEISSRFFFLPNMLESPDKPDEKGGQITSLVARSEVTFHRTVAGFANAASFQHRVMSLDSHLLCKGVMLASMLSSNYYSFCKICHAWTS